MKYPRVQHQILAVLIVFAFSAGVLVEAIVIGRKIDDYTAAESKRREGDRSQLIKIGQGVNSMHSRVERIETATGADKAARRKTVK